MYRNTTVSFNGLVYEVFWTSQFARHVCQNLYAGDNLHDLDHEEIVRALAVYEHVQEFLEGRCVFLSRYRERVYEMHVHLEPGTAKRPGRCTIKTCYRSNKQQYIRLFK